MAKNKNEVKVEDLKAKLKTRLKKDGFGDCAQFTLIAEVCLYRILHTEEGIKPIKLVTCYRAISEQYNGVYTPETIKAKINIAFRDVSKAREKKGLPGFKVDRYIRELMFDLGGGCDISRKC